MKEALAQKYVIGAKIQKLGKLKDEFLCAIYSSVEI